MTDQPDARAQEGRRVIARLADELLPVLIARLEASSLGELEVREDGWRVRLRRPMESNGAHIADAAPAGRAGAHDGSADARQPAAAQRSEPDHNLVSSPAVGYFVPREGVAPGAAVRSGDLIGHIDVLGVQQEVVVPADGIVTRVEVEPGQAVEYGEPIARLEPETRD
jgi:acetyl-CoA carboxylase biotin carboxyl carrier protein